MSSESSISVTLPTLGKVRVNFYDVANEVFNIYKESKEFNRQKRIRHLGVISEVFECASHSRYEYIIFQCALVDIADNIHKGGAVAGQGSIKVKGINYFGNSILKSWFMLSNFGHAKNTIGDEKSILFFCRRSASFRENILKIIIDESLKKYSEKVINEFRYTEFHYVLAFWRLYKLNPKNIEIFVDLYKLLLLDDEYGFAIDREKLARLKQLFKCIRAISIVAIDGHYSHTINTLNITPALYALENESSLYRGRSALENLTPFMSVLYEDIYLDKDVQKMQRSYELNALEVLKNSEENQYDEVLNQTFQMGLVDPSQCRLRHFARFIISDHIKAHDSLYEEHVNLQKTIKTAAGCESSVDDNPITKNRVADFYFPKYLVSQDIVAKFLFNLADLLNNQFRFLFDHFNNDNSLGIALGILEDCIGKVGNEDSRVHECVENVRNIFHENIWEEVKSYIIPAYKELLWSIIHLFLPDSCKLEISSVPDGYESFSMRLPSSDLDLYKNIGEAKFAESRNTDRVKEIEQVEQSAKEDFDGYVLVCISRINIFDENLSPDNRIKTDIDGVVVKLSETETIIEFHETKNVKRGIERKAIKDLEEKLLPTLILNNIDNQLVKVEGFGAKLVLKYSANR